MWFVVISSLLGGAPFKIEHHSRVPLILSWKSSGGCPFGRQKMAEGGMLDAGGGGGGGDGVVVLWCCIWSPRKRQEAELWGAAHFSIQNSQPKASFGLATPTLSSCSQCGQHASRLLMPLDCWKFNLHERNTNNLKQPNDDNISNNTSDNHNSHNNTATQSFQF